VIGVDGPLRWSDLQSHDIAAGAAGDAPVELIVPMSP
jgi:hypothetical protein